jgi:hypothetical protein
MLTGFFGKVKHRKDLKSGFVGVLMRTDFVLYDFMNEVIPAKAGIQKET